MLVLPIADQRETEARACYGESGTGRGPATDRQRRLASYLCPSQTDIGVPAAELTDL